MQHAAHTHTHALRPDGRRHLQLSATQVPTGPNGQLANKNHNDSDASHNKNLFCSAWPGPVPRCTVRWSRPSVMGFPWTRLATSGGRWMA